MRLLITTLFAFFAVQFFGQERINIAFKVEGEDGLSYYNDEPITGIVYLDFFNGYRSYEAFFLNGKQNGLTRAWHSNGLSQIEYNLSNGKKDGIQREWYDNGQLLIFENYKDGKREGKFTEWYKNGKLKFEAFYINDLKDGNRRRWYENGQLMFESIYSNDKLISQKCWDENGQIIECP
jgi:antitoxin component YwqK of YwqJK toxin-antitoxin module